MRPVAGERSRDPGEPKFAVTLFGPAIVNEAGLAEPVKSPAQLEKTYPVFGLADTDTLCPLLYQFTPGGLTVPPAEGVADVVKLC